MDYEKDMLEDFEIAHDPYELRPECILTDKVFDACFQRECEPSKVVDLPARAHWAMLMWFMEQVLL